MENFKKEMNKVIQRKLIETVTNFIQLVSLQLVD